MIVERFNPGAAVAIYRRFRDAGRQLPPGLEYVDSWVDLDCATCFQLMRTSDPATVDTWMRAWSDLATFQIFAVQTSADAAHGIAGKL